MPASSRFLVRRTKEISNSPYLILMAHGSRDPAWRRYFEKIAAELSGKKGKRNIRLAYMELVSPTFVEVIERLWKKGVRRIRVLPLFMAGGRHVDRNIPQQISEVRKRHKSLEIKLLKPIGEYKEVRWAILKTAKSAAG